MDKTEKKIVYAYNTDGKLIGPKTLDWTDRSPVSGDWQIPGQCTDTAPLAAKDGDDIYWKGIAWEYQEQPKQEASAPADTPTKTTGATQPTLANRVAALEAVANKTVMG